jgi:NAD(P)-dependent dehydrogenase (short-subunit alcohol dehydrogenase family)
MGDWAGPRSWAFAPRESKAITGRNPEKNALAIQALGNPKAVLSVGCVERRGRRTDGKPALDHFGRLDILVNNAGNVRVRALTELSREALDEILETHLTGAFQRAKYAAKAMIACGEDRHAGVDACAGG